jgi:hypothetical protein
MRLSGKAINTVPNGASVVRHKYLSFVWHCGLDPESRCFKELWLGVSTGGVAQVAACAFRFFSAGIFFPICKQSVSPSLVGSYSIEVYPLGRDIFFWCR